MTLTQEQVTMLRGKGFSDNEIRAAEAKVEQQQSLTQSYDAAMQRRQQDPRNQMAVGHMGQAIPNNSVEWQVELDSIIGRIEHLLRGDKPTLVGNSIIFVPAKEEADRIFNDRGVTELLRVVTAYVNRNTIFSNYDEETIKWKVYDFGIEFADFIYMNYEEFGLTTQTKRKKYMMLVREIVDMVHSTYLRALGGKERDSIRKMFNISENLSTMEQMPQMRPQQGKSWFKPWTWGK